MRRTLLNVIAGLGVALLLLLGLIAIGLPRLIETEQIQASLRSAASEALGSEVDWRGVSLGLWPLRLNLDSPMLKNQSVDSEQARLAVGSVELRLALLPIFERRLQVDSLVFRDLELVVTRTETGLILPVGSPEMDSEADPAGEVDPEAVETSGEEAIFDLVLERLVVRGGRVIVLDQTLPDTVEWRLEEIELEARGDSIEEPIDVELTARLDSGRATAGALAVRGVVSLRGVYDLDLELDGLDLETLQPYLSDFELTGLLSGRVSLGGASDAPDAVEVDLDIAQLGMRGGGLDLRGDLALTASRVGDAQDGSGSDLDLGLEDLGGSDFVRFDATLALAVGGQVAVVGVAGKGGVLDARFDLDGVDLGVLASLIPAGVQIEGAATGRIDIRSAAEQRIERFDLDLRVPELRLGADSFDLSGALSVVAGFGKDDSVALDLGLALSGGGRLDVRGTSSLEGLLDLDLALDQLDLALVQPLLPDPGMAVGGRATGTGRLVGAALGPEVVALDIRVEAGLLRMPEYKIDGPFLLGLKIEEPFSGSRHGQLALDLTAASLEYAGHFEFKKRAGLRAEVVTDFMPDASGAIVFESRIKLRHVDEILLRGRAGDSISVAITIPSFELEGWSEVLPRLEPYSLAGRVAFEDLAIELAGGVPGRFGGRIEIEGVTLRVPDGADIRLRGRILGEGRSVRLEALKARSAGLVLEISGELIDPFGEAICELAVRSANKAEVNDLLSAFTSVKDTVFGPLELTGRLKGTASSESDFYRTLEGDFRFSIGKDRGGRLQGVSILRSVLDQVPLLAGAASLFQAFRGTRSLDDFLGEDFQIIEGDFLIGNGLANARKLRLAYEGYEARLSGPLRLRDLSLDMTGELLLKSDLLHVLEGSVGADSARRKPIRIPLARVTHTLSDPKVEMTAETLAALPGLLFQATGLDGLATGLGEALGRALGGRSD